MKKELPITFDSASARKTGYYYRSGIIGGYATSDKDLAKKMRAKKYKYYYADLMLPLGEIKDKIIKKIQSIKLRRK